MRNLLSSTGVRRGILLLFCLILLPCGGSAEESSYDVPDYLKRWGAPESEIVDFLYYFPEAPLDITTALKLWQPVMEEYKQRLMFPRPLRLMFFRKRDELEKFLKESPVAIAFFPLDYYLANKERLNIRPYSTFQYSDESHYTVLLLAKSDSSIKKLEDLKGRKLATTRTADNQNLFLSRIVFSGQVPIESFFESIIYPHDVYSTVQTLRLGMADAALIPEYFLRVLEELNPAFTRDLRIVYRSPTIPMPPFVYFQDNITETDLKVFLKVVQEVNALPSVKQALMILKLKAVVEVSDETYADVEKLWKEAEKSPMKKKAGNGS